MLISSYTTTAENQRQSPCRPPNVRDAHDRHAWEIFGELIAAANRGQSGKARNLANNLFDLGYRVESLPWTNSFRLVLPGSRRAS